MELKILGISGSPVRGGNVDTFLAKALESVDRPETVIETAFLSESKVQDCIQCNFCWRKQEEHRYCILDDDAQALFEKAETADVIVLATPVYIMRTSARMAAFLDRMRLFLFGNLTAGRLRNKVGVSLAVSWSRNAGLETAHLSHLFAFGIFEMIPAAVHDSVSPMGGSAVSSEHGMGVFDRNIRLGVLRDEGGLASGRKIMERAVELAEIVKYGTRRRAAVKGNHIE
jgi:multimeric flavodoxin WrbA